ncbi:MAG: hypothetical protein OXC83_02670 [Chloroflexi bacterium]|nr:hypothetical protein [Chloroflexota bacterium]
MAAEPSISIHEVQVEIDRSLEHYASKAELNEAVGRLDAKISETETRLIRWMVGTVVGVGALVVGAVAVLLNVID